MTALLIFSSLGSILVFGVLAIWLSIKEEKTQKLLLEREDTQKQRIYEVTILKEIQDRIGYELDIEKVADVITGSLRNLFPYATTSSLIVKNDHLIFKTYAEQRVSHTFVEQVKRTVLASLAALSDKPLPTQIDDVTSGSILDDANTLPVESFFNIPLIIDNEVVGVINISSTEPGLYKENQMTILYQITNLASSAISKLKHVLNTEKGKLTAMISSLADGVFMVNTHKQMQTINPTAKNILGIKKEEVSMIDIAQVIGNQCDLSQAIDEALASQKPLPPKELLIHDKNIQVFVTPVRDSTQQTLLGASILLHDISLEKNLEQMKDDFTNMMVHELRAPLTAIRGASSLMEKSGDTLSPEEKQRLLSISTEQSNKLLDLVSTILDAAKLEAGKFVLQKSPTDIKKEVEKTIALFQTAATTKQITITLTAQDNLPQVALDPLRFDEVMNNLISNALKYTPQHGKILISLIPTASAMVVAVSDSGVGIPPEKQEQLFSKFYQVKHEAKDLNYITAGTGLGLYIVKGIIEAHGGTVSVKSTPGQGATFSFTIPFTTTVQEQQTNKLTTTPPPPSQIFKTTVH
jgi:signal transduction histidine kinase